MKPSDVTDSSEIPPRLVLRSARSADDATTDSDDIVKQTVATGSSDSSLLASYTPSDWADRNERYNTVIASDTFQDHHHSESSMYRKQRRTPWSGQKVSFFAAHGTPTRVKLTRQDGTSIVVSGRELGRYLEHSAELGPKDRPIVLYACSTGASPTHGGLSVAQHVANVTGLPVYAPTTSAGTALDSEQRPRPVLFRDDAENSGQWITYTPEPTGAELTALARTAGLHPRQAPRRTRTPQPGPAPPVPRRRRRMLPAPGSRRERSSSYVRCAAPSVRRSSSPPTTMRCWRRSAHWTASVSGATTPSGRPSVTGG